MKLKSIDGIPVTNAKHQLKLHITKRDCSVGDIKDPSTCAAAKTIRREYGAIDCRVHLGRVYIRQNKGNWQRYMTPRSLRTEIIAFDRGGEFQPGEYILAAPSAKRTTGKRQGGNSRFKNSRNNPNRKKRRSPTIVQNVRGGPATGDQA